MQKTEKSVHSREIHSVHESNLNIFSCFFYISKWWFRIWNSRLFSTTNQGWHFQFNSLHFIAFSKMQSNAHITQWPHTYSFRTQTPMMIYDLLAWQNTEKWTLSMEYKFKSIAFVPGVQFNFILKYGVSFVLPLLSLYLSTEFVVWMQSLFVQNCSSRFEWMHSTVQHEWQKAVHCCHCAFWRWSNECYG